MLKKKLIKKKKWKKVEKWIYGEKEIGLTIINKETEKEEKTLVAKSLNEFKQKVIDFIGEDIENKKDYYFKNMKYDIYKERKDNLERLEEKVDFNKTDIKTDKDFSFEFTDKNKENYKYDYKLVIADKENKYNSMYKYTNYRKISMSLVDENFSDYFTTTSNGALENHYLKIDYLKEKNKDIMKQINENIEKESFNMAKADIVLMSVYETRGKRAKIGETRDFSELLSESIDTSFFNRIGNLKEKESFVEKNADELGLSLNVYGKVDEIYSEDENQYKANVEAVLKTLEEGSLNNFFENLENQKEKMERYSHSDVLIENVIHKMSYDMKGDIRQDIAKSLDFDSIVRNTATLIMIEENFTVEDAKNIKNMSDEEKSQFVDKINDYISERGSHIKEVKVSDLSKLEKVNFDKVSDLRENSFKEEQRKENQKERAYQRDERTDREYDF